MPDQASELASRYTAALNAGDLEGLSALLDEDVVVDFSRSIRPDAGVSRGRDGARSMVDDLREVWSEYRFEVEGESDLGPDTVLLAGSFTGRGRVSGAEVTARGAHLWTLAGGRIKRLELYQSAAEALRSWRLRGLERARLYFVCEASPNGGDPGPLLDAALRGGADVLQLRDKALGDEELVEAARPFRAAAREHGALFLLNDRPDLTAACEADGVHVGQEDASVADARADSGPEVIVGLSTHAPEQLDAACEAQGVARPDYLSVGPVWETPTKEGRPAAGLEYVSHARACSTIPWFAIGGIDATNVGQAVAAGAERIAVVRAIRDAEDPEEAARVLSWSLERQPVR